MITHRSHSGVAAAKAGFNLCRQTRTPGPDGPATSLQLAAELAALQRRMVLDLEQFLSASLASRAADCGDPASPRAT